MGTIGWKFEHDDADLALIARAQSMHPETAFVVEQNRSGVRHVFALRALLRQKGAVLSYRGPFMKAPRYLEPVEVSSLLHKFAVETFVRWSAEEATKWVPAHEVVPYMRRATQTNHKRDGKPVGSMIMSQTTAPAVSIAAPLSGDSTRDWTLVLLASLTDSLVKCPAWLAARCVARAYVQTAPGRPFRHKRRYRRLATRLEVAVRSLLFRDRLQARTR